MISIWLKWYWDGYKMVLQKNARRYREGMGIKMSFIQFWQTLCRYGLTAREDWVALKPYLDSGDRLTHLATTTDAQMIKKDFVRTMLQNGRVYSVRSRMPAILDVGGLGSAGDENDGGPPAVRMIVFEVLDVNPGGKVTAERKEYDEFFLPISVQMWTASSAYDDPEAPPQSVRLRPQGLPIMISALDTFVDFLFDYLKDTLCGTLSNDTLFRVLVLVCQSLVLYWNRNTKVNVQGQ